MRRLFPILLATLASLRTTAESKTLLVASLPDKKQADDFSDQVGKALNDLKQITFQLNPLKADFLEEKAKLEFDTVFIQSHGNKFTNGLPYLNIFEREEVPITEVVATINQDNSDHIAQIHISACYVGTNFHLINDPQSPYHQEIKESLKENQLLVLHGDEYQGVIVSSLDRLPPLCAGREYSIIEALLDSAENLKVVLKKNGQLKTYEPKMFGRDNEKWTIENYRNYLREVAKDAQKFEDENNIMSSAAIRPNIEDIKDEKLEKSLGDVFVSYFNKLLDEKDWARLRQLIENNPNTYIRKDGCTALMSAAKKGHADIVKLLIDRGATRDIAQKDGLTALMYAADGGHADVVQLLIDLGAKLDLVQKDDCTALIIAAHQGHADIVKSLIDGAANPDLKQEDGWTALIFAAEKGRADIAKLLMDGGADTTIINNEGYNAYTIALAKGYEKIAQDIQDHSQKNHKNSETEEVIIPATVSATEFRPLSMRNNFISK